MKALAAFLLSFSLFAHAQHSRVPQLSTTALDGHPVAFPEDLHKLNVIIVGFTRSSAEHTTAWQKSTRRELQPAGVDFYDITILESLPKFMRGMVSGLIKNKVPTVLKPHFVMLFEGEAEWKRAVDFDPQAEDAAYVLITDRDGRILWSTHEAFSNTSFAALKRQLHRVGMK